MYPLIKRKIKSFTLPHLSPIASSFTSADLQELYHWYQSIAPLTCEMGDHSTRLQEMRREIDGLKGSMEGVVGSVAELSKIVDTKVANAMNEIKKLIATMAVGNEQRGNGVGEAPVDNGGQDPRDAREKEYQLPTRNYQMEFPSFDGTGLKEWIYRSEQFFEVDETPAAAKVKLASCRLEGKALQWHQTFMKNRVTREWPSWGEFVRCLFSRFSTKLFDDPMGDFKDLQQVSSVQDYVDTLDELLTRVELADEYIVSCFIRGLKPGCLLRCFLQDLCKEPSVWQEFKNKPFY